MAELTDKRLDELEKPAMFNAALVATTLGLSFGELRALIRARRAANALVAERDYNDERRQYWQHQALLENNARVEAEAERDALKARVAELEADAIRYRYLRDYRADHWPMTHDQPAEWSIQWEFQQIRPDQRYGTLDGWIDADIAQLDDDERAALAHPTKGADDAK